MIKNNRSHNAAPVKVSYSFMKIMTGSDLSLKRLPLMSAKSANPGPVVWLTACGHGDEVCGIVIVQEIFKNIRKTLLCGSVYAFPLMNPIGFETVSRNITVSREDLNRSFPGRQTGTLGERLASRIFCTIVDTSPSLVIDLHNDWINSIPYALIVFPHIPILLALTLSPISRINLSIRKSAMIRQPLTTFCRYLGLIHLVLILIIWRLFLFTKQRLTTKYSDSKKSKEVFYLLFITIKRYSAS